MSIDQPCKLLALALLDAWAVRPMLVADATADQLRAFCCALDPNGDFDVCTLADLRAVALEWVADHYHTTTRG